MPVIQQTRIRSLGRHFSGFDAGDKLVLGARIDDETTKRLPDLGFPSGWVKGEAVLPPADLGTVARRNAEGYEIVHKDQPMETVTRQIEWTWEEWHGPYREEQSKIVDVPYERYPRTFVPPAGLELAAAESPDAGELVVVDHSFELGADDDLLIHGVNLMLEAFGECEVFAEDLTAIMPAQLRRLNWEVLPRGKHPWADLQGKVHEVLDAMGERERPVYEHRLKKVAGAGPDFTAVGRAGFTGYVIYGFPAKGFCVLESAHYGNATYILDIDDWERLSQMTKAELLSDDLHQRRIVHRDGWDREIDALLQ